MCVCVFLYSFNLAQGNIAFHNGFLCYITRAESHAYSLRLLHRDGTCHTHTFAAELDEATALYVRADGAIVLCDGKKLTVLTL